VNHEGVFRVVSIARALFACPDRCRFALILGVAIALLPTDAVALEGSLSGYLPAGTYRITDDIDVPAGQTLTLAPGVVFEFEDDFWEEYEFDVYGTLLAEGTEQDRIIFRPAAGVPEYNYIRIAGAGSRLEHCLIDGVGSVTAASEGGLWIDGTSPLIDRCEVRNATWHGIYVTGGSAAPTITETEVHGCSNDGIDGDNSASMTVIRCIIRDNGADGICLASGANVIVGCLIEGNGEDGIDSHGLDDYEATIIGCTIGTQSSEALSDASNYDLYNCVVADEGMDVGVVEHSYLMDDLWFLGFVNAGAGDYRLSATSPCRDAGTPFGPVAAWLPTVDLDGNPRPNGVVDVGGYESTLPPETGESGLYFSDALIRPRMTQPEIRVPGESIEILVANGGSYILGDVAVRLVDCDGAAHPLIATAVTAEDAVPGSDLALRLYTMGIETVQRIDATIPAGTPSGFHGIEVDLGALRFESIHAMRVVDAYPDPWRFIHITDTHVGYDAETYTSAARLRFFVREANFLNPDLVVITGDILENQNLENDDWVDSLLHALADLEAPVVVQPGNHDHYNDGGDHNEHGYFRFFQRINRVRNAEVRFGGAAFYFVNSGHDLGLVELYRCRGPESAALDWVETKLGALDPVADRPRFLLMHGPNYDYFSYNEYNTSRVRDLMNTWGFSLGLAGHTHRFETYRNEGDNYFGRNDFVHEDDWGRDVPFPGFPLHVQTSSLGKEEHLNPGLVDERGEPIIDAAGEPIPAMPAGKSTAGEKGIFGDNIGFRYVHVAAGEVDFFTADNDGDGYRNTEDAWLLGAILFHVDTLPDGSIVSTVTNDHYETWHDVRHRIPADPSVVYEATGGTILYRDTDGTAVVGVDSALARAVSTVTLTPIATAVAAGAAGAPAPFHLGANTPNPFNPTTTVRFSLPKRSSVLVTVHDVAGRRIAILEEALREAGEHTARWDGRDLSGRDATSGIYFARLQADGLTATRKMMLIR